MARVIAAAVTVYLVIVAVVAWRVGPPALLDPVPSYRLSVAWVLPSTSEDRRGALARAGRAEVAHAYRAVEAASWTLIALLAGLGAAAGARTEAPRRLPRREVIAVIGGFAVLLVMAGQMTTLAHALEQMGTPPAPGFNAMPGYWIATTAVSGAIMGRYAAWLAHDAALTVRGWLAAPPLVSTPIRSDGIVAGRHCEPKAKQSRHAAP